MEPQAKHTMTIAQTYPSGAEEWVCPTCGLRFILQWPPNYKKIILQEGDETSIHSGGKGGVVMGAPEMGPALPEPDEDQGIGPAFEDDLGPWADFLGS